ncbi:pyridoxamine 5'-phosphate oxidase family protein [Nonomuraea africana]|uniref:pyridoxamine 5'-phosphate oxidase family protein n=1 Tax=Nonomuraea africana TaxID=46171 RepID=UPI0033D17170
MAAHRVAAFSAIRQDFEDIVGDVVYATMTTVDAKGRPRSRVLLPIWEMTGDSPVGWLATFDTPVKRAHLAGNPHATFSYWSPAQNTVAVDTVARWETDEAVKKAVWELYRQGSPPGVGYDPQAYWRRGPEDPGYHLLRMDPWRIQVLRGRDLATGRPSRIWVAPPQEDRRP